MSKLKECSRSSHLSPSPSLSLSISLSALANCQLPVVATRERRCVGISIHMSCQTIAGGGADWVGELTDVEGNLLIYAEPSRAATTKPKPKLSRQARSPARLVALTDGRVLWGCVAVAVVVTGDCRYRLCLYKSCDQTTQYINSPALAYFILRKKIMANIRELCDAAHQRAIERSSVRHDR